MTDHLKFVPLWVMAREVRDVVDPSTLPADVMHYSIPAFDESGGARRESAGNIQSLKHQLRGDEVLISKLNPRKSRVVLVHPSDIPSVASTEFISLRTSPGVERRYLAYHLSSEPVRQELDSQVRSVTRSHQRVDPKAIARLSVRSLDIYEQQRIVAFLDSNTGKLDTLLRLRKGQIQKVKERAHSAVAACFSGCRSGTQIALKRILKARPRYGVLVPEFVGDGIPFIRVGDLSNLSDGTGDLRKIPTHQSEQYKTTIVRPGDVLVSVVGTLGRAAVVETGVAGANVNRAIAVVRALPSVDPYLLQAWFMNGEFERQASMATSSDSAQRTLGMEDLSNFVIRWPTSDVERKEIVDRIGRVQDQARRVSNLLEQQIQTLEERRQALITAAVAGKIDVSTAGRMET